MIKTIKFVVEVSKTTEIEVTPSVLSEEDEESLFDNVYSYMLTLNTNPGDRYYDQMVAIRDKTKKNIFVILHQVAKTHGVDYKSFKTIYFHKSTLYVKI